LRQLKWFYWVPLLVVALASMAVPPKLFAQYAPGGPKLKGTVKLADGKPLEGVTVSIRGNGKSWVTTVFTNAQGLYVFPPVQQGLKYRLWAQAQGFEYTQMDVTANGSGEQQVPALQLKTLANFEKQMTGVEWMNSFPEKTAADKRAKQIFASNCSGCHDNHFALQNRFDADGWGKIITVMSKDSEGTPFNSKAEGEQAMNAYKADLVAFLTKVRGPAPRDYELKPLPRPTGEAARVVITEFDMPRAEAPPESYLHNGSDWMEGPPSRWEGRAAHDITIGGDGNLYFSDDRASDRTISMLNPRTGGTQLFAFPGKSGGAASVHSIATDPDGNVWVDSFDDANLIRLDVKSKQFKDFPRPVGMPGVGGTVTVDNQMNKGIVWATARSTGAVRLDPKTAKYTFYPLVTPEKANTYGITVDRGGNAWYTSPGGDRVDVIDGETGKTSEIVFKPLGPESGMEVTDQDKKNYANLDSNQNSATPLHNCPRRIGADPNADVVWVALFCADKIASIDTRTHKVTEYDVPQKYSRPYGLIVDNDHNVWINMLNTDMITKFNPTTKTFIQYQMPSRGTDIRHLVFDYITNPPELYMPYNRSNKVARIQFRKPGDME
jgi:virginiamycin B lyase